MHLLLHCSNNELIYTHFIARKAINIDLFRNIQEGPLYRLSEPCPPYRVNWWVLQRDLQK